MQKTKLKTDTPITIGLIPFVILWAMTHAGGWLMALGIFELLDEQINVSLSNQMSNVIGITTVLLTTALLQGRLVERVLHRSMRGWLLYSIIGTFITLFTFINAAPASSGFFVAVLSLLLPVAIAQAVWLRRRVESAWLWVLASAAAAMLFALPVNNGEMNSEQTLLIGAALYGLVQGGIMRHLWLHPKRAEKPKHAAADMTETAETAAAERLSAQAQQPALAAWRTAQALADETRKETLR